MCPGLAFALGDAARHYAPPPKGENVAVAQVNVVQVEWSHWHGLIWGRDNCAFGYVAWDYVLCPYTQASFPDFFHY